jgi:hypothetical protein
MPVQLQVFYEPIGQQGHCRDGLWATLLTYSDLSCLCCVAPKFYNKSSLWVIRVIFGAGLDFRFTPVSDKTAALH